MNLSNRSRGERSKGATPPPRRGLRRWSLLLGGIAALVIALFIVWRVQASQKTATPVQTANVTRGDLNVTLQGSGPVQANRHLDFPFQVGGQVDEVLIKAGDHVKTGQILARLDTRDLDLAVQQAQANVTTAQAKLDATQHGDATSQDLDSAKSAVASAEANLEKTKTGNLTQADIDNAQAAVSSARLNLEKTKTGNITQADLTNAQAAVKAAEANYEKVKTGDITQADIDSAQAAVRAAEANYEKVKTGNITQADIDSAQASVRAAEANLAQVQAGPTPDQISTVRTALTKAQQSYQQTADGDSTAKTTAEQNMNQAADNIRLAQQAYSTAYWNNQQAQNGVDPTNGKRFSDEGQNTGIQQQNYAAALQAAQIAINQAQSKLDQARLQYDSARQQEITDLATAKASVDDAQAQLDEVLKGPKEADLVNAQTQLDQAKASFTKLTQGGTAADLVSAQAQVDQAKASLTKLTQGPTKADLASAQAQVDQAKASLTKLQQGGTAADVGIARDNVTQAQSQLDKLKQGGTPEDIEGAQAQVDQAQTALDKLTAPAAEPDITSAQAALEQAQAALTSAQLNRDRSTLVAPFDATVSSVSIVPGAIASANTTAVSLDDRSALHVDVNMSESDVGRVDTGQPVQLTFDALPGTVISGTVDTIAPTSTVEQNVVTYLVQVKFNPSATPVKLGMTANTDITVQQVKNALLVPSRAIQTQGQNHSVQVIDSNSKLPINVAIQTGATDGAQTEVLSCVDTGTQCLREGDRLVIPTATTTTRTTTGGTTGRPGGFGGGFGGGGGVFTGR